MEEKLESNQTKVQEHKTYGLNTQVKTTIPKAIAKMMGLKHGSVLDFSIDPLTNGVVIKKVR